MTKEEAIEIFINRGWIKVEGGTYFDGDKWREAVIIISDYLQKGCKALEQEPNKWIPVSERLPEDGEVVITINEDKDYAINHVIDEDNSEWFYDGAIAWMPLPKPYKVESEE